MSKQRTIAPRGTVMFDRAGQETVMTTTPAAPMDWRVSSLVNLTPHALDIYGDDGALIMTLPPSGTVARVADDPQADHAGLVVGGGPRIPLRMLLPGEPEGLPAPQPGTNVGPHGKLPAPAGYVVSRVMADAMRQRGLLRGHGGRRDIFIPGPAVRDEAGRQVGCTGLYSP